MFLCFTKLPGTRSQFLALRIVLLIFMPTVIFTLPFLVSVSLFCQAIPEEVKPKFVKGTKRYGRKSRPDRPNSELTADSEETPPFRTDTSETTGVRRAKLRRSTSLESVEVTDELHPHESLEKMLVEGLAGVHDCSQAQDSKTAKQRSPQLDGLLLVLALGPQKLLEQKNRSIVLDSLGV